MIKLDNNIAHDSRVQRDNVGGYFCGIPVVTLDEVSVGTDIRDELRIRLGANTGKSIPAEVLPGEEICADNIIRRSTTTEVIGYDTYHNQVAIEAGTERGGINVARLASLAGKLITWRPNRDVNPATEFALIHQEG